MSSPTRRIATAVRRALRLADRGPLRRGALVCAEVFIRLTAFYLRVGLPAGIHVRGGFAFGEPVVGLSDVDLVAVVRGPDGAGGDSCAALLSRWRRLERFVPGLRHVVYLECYLERELHELRWTRFTYGLDGHSPRSLFFGGSPRSWRHQRRSLPLLLPDLWPSESWRVISGPNLRPSGSARSPTHSHLLTWVHLQYWWQVALRTLAEPAAPWSVYACVKLVAEPAKILLWLEHGEQHFARREILQRALEALPDEAPTIAFALDLLDDLRCVDAAPINDVWPCFVRLAVQIAQRLSADLDSLGETTVQLRGLARTDTETDAPRGGLPLCDWTALVCPPGREEWFETGEGHADDLAAVLAAVECSTPTRFVTLLRDGLIVRPGRLGRKRFRAVDCGATDPVSASLLRGDTIASFPNATGWSASDTATRAVAEHAAWLQLPRNRAQEPARRHLGGVFSAARAGLFLESIRERDPILPVTFEATATALADRIPRYRGAIEEAYDSWRAAPGAERRADLETLRILAAALSELGWYTEPFPHLFPRAPHSAGPCRLGVGA